MVWAPLVAKRWTSAKIAFGWLVLALCVLFLYLSCSTSARDKLTEVKASGELVVLVHRSPATYYDGADGIIGFEHDLTRAFAESLGVKAKFVVSERASALLPKLQNGDADMATGIGLAEDISQRFLTTPPYQQVRQQVIYRQGNPRPRSIEDLIGRQVEIEYDTHYAARLRELQQTHANLKWAEVDDSSTEELLEMVWDGLLEVTIADSHLIALNRQFFPELQVAFDFSPPRGIAWAFNRSDDTSLHQAAVEFLAQYQAKGELTHLIDRYYGPANQPGHVTLTVYHARIDTRLPLYQNLFQIAAREVNLDWRLLAAVSYQESYWDPNAMSPTGVRGMMMLTEDTAKQMGVSDLFDPMQSILGGALFLRTLYDRMRYIPEPDRLWFTLAAYNIGPQHLEDARVITQRHGKDPKKWSNVKEYLPLLEEPKWYNDTIAGFARGNETVMFVNRIRAYYDVLVKRDEAERAKSRMEAFKLKVPSI